MLVFFNLLQQLSAQILGLMLGCSYAGSGLLQLLVPAALTPVAMKHSSLQLWPHRESWNGLVCALMWPTLHPPHLAGETY